MANMSNNVMSEADLKAKLNGRIKQVIKERTGPSFEERVQASAAAFRKEVKVVEAVQAKKIEDAMARAKAKPSQSPFRSKDLTPPTIEQMGKEHARTRRENEARYAQLHAERKNRMDTREPLFKLEEVSNAFEMQKQRQAQHRKDLQEDENRRWDHLQEIQERVINRPLLLEGGEGVPTEEEPKREGGEKDPNWKEKFKQKMHKRIQTTMKERCGPSFEERVAIRSAKFAKEAKATVEAQTKVIDAAVARAKALPSNSPFRSKDLTPPTIEDFAKVHAETRRENEEWYANECAKSKHKQDTREPLFRVSEVEAAFEEQRKRQKKYQKELRDDEKARWEMLGKMKEKVIGRPLLVEVFERPVHSKSAPELRLIPNHTKPVMIEQNINNSVQSKWFKDSAWGKEVATLRERMDARPKLHEIPYPPKKFEEKPPPPKLHNPLDQRLMEVMNQPWFKKSQWASEVAAIQQRQDDRPKLHEISYPPKKYDD